MSKWLKEGIQDVLAAMESASPQGADWSRRIKAAFDIDRETYRAIVESQAADVIAARDFLEANSWQPIESAPNEVGIIVAYAVGTRGRVDIGFVPADENDYEWQADDGKRLVGVSVPTHWMPLPEPPK